MMFAKFYHFLSFSHHSLSSGTKEEVLTSSCQGGKVTSCSVLNVLNSQVRHEPIPSASTLLSFKGDWNQSNWQEAVKNFLLDCDDLTLCPGSDLLTPQERQVSECFVF
jgi:hypothetical protein